MIQLTFENQESEDEYLTQLLMDIKQTNEKIHVKQISTE